MRQSGKVDLYEFGTSLVYKTSISKPVGHNEVLTGKFIALVSYYKVGEILNK